MGVCVCVRVHACIRRPNKPCVWWGEQRLGVTPLDVLHIYNPFQRHDGPTTDTRPSTGPARHGTGGSFDACRYHCVMMSHGDGERGRVGGKIKGKREGWRSWGEDIQDNNGTKMATVCAAGRPPVSGPPGPGSPPARSSPRSGKMATAKAMRRNRRVKPSYLRRSASTVRAPSAPRPSSPWMADVWLPSLHPKCLSRVAFLSNYFPGIFSFLFLPLRRPPLLFHHGLLAVNVGLSLPSKAAHQLPWLPSVRVRVNGRKERRGEKEENPVSKIKALFMPDFGLGPVFLSIVFPPGHFYNCELQSLGGAVSGSPWRFKVLICKEKKKLKRFCLKSRSTDNFFLFSPHFFLWEYSAACRLLSRGSASKMTIRETIFE